MFLPVTPDYDARLIKSPVSMDSSFQEAGIQAGQHFMKKSRQQKGGQDNDENGEKNLPNAWQIPFGRLSVAKGNRLDS